MTRGQDEPIPDVLQIAFSQDCSEMQSLNVKN